jgi:acetyl esterase/lipase
MATEIAPLVIPLWPDDAPDAAGANWREQTTVIPVPRFNNRVRDMKVVRNYSAPTLTAYLPDPAMANGTALIICPGGGFSCLPIEIEGLDVAHWLNRRGVAAVVLRYRLLPTPRDDEQFIRQMQRPDPSVLKMHMPLALKDGQQSVRLVRQRATEWGLNPQRIGIIGFSAGGVVAAGTATQSQPAERPDFVACLYSPGWQDFTVQADTPPLFMAFASDDPVLTLVSDGSLKMYGAWKDAKRPIEMHVYSKGGHGFGLAQQGLPCDGWVERFVEWLRVQDIPA